MTRALSLVEVVDGEMPTSSRKDLAIIDNVCCMRENDLNIRQL
jgi:hypothetical protein